MLQSPMCIAFSTQDIEQQQLYLCGLPIIFRMLHPYVPIHSLNLYTIMSLCISITHVDAEVRFVMEEYSVMEESGSVTVCVELVAGGFEANLTLNLSAQDGIACEHHGSIPSLNIAMYIHV